MKRLLYLSFLSIGTLLSPAAFGQLDFLGMEEEPATVSVQETKQALMETENTEQNRTPENTLTSADSTTSAKLAEDKTSDTAKPDIRETEKTADITAGSEDFLDKYIDDIETGKEAKSTARKILEHKPVILKLRQNQLKSLEKIENLYNRQTKVKAQKDIQVPQDVQTADTLADISENKKQTESVDTATAEKEYQQLSEKLQSAPLGFFWGASLSEIQALGFELKPAERKDYKNVYLVLNAKQRNQTFRLISAIFGNNDSLWCIYAESNLLDDTPEASKVLALYRKYYKALEKKYGNAQEFFTPYTDEELLITGTSAQNAITKDGETAKPATHEIGNGNFLKELQEGKAVLYATFGDDTIGATLGVSVDGDLKSYISLDYKNYALQKKEQDAVFDSILNDL